MTMVTHLPRTGRDTLAGPREMNTSFLVLEQMGSRAALGTNGTQPTTIQWFHLADERILRGLHRIDCLPTATSPEHSHVYMHAIMSWAEILGPDLIWSGRNKVPPCHMPGTISGWPPMRGWLLQA